MSTLAAVAADLAYAAGHGATKLAAEVRHAGATKAEIGVSLPGSGLIPAPGSGLLAAAPSASAAEIASSMAVDAADKGVRLIEGHR